MMVIVLVVVVVVGGLVTVGVGLVAVVGMVWSGLRVHPQHSCRISVLGEQDTVTGLHAFIPMDPRSKTHNSSLF